MIQKQTSDVGRLEAQAVNLIRSASKYRRYVLSYSGGKDSEVLLHLFRKARVDFDIVYKSTTIDPPGTIKWCQSKGANILRPKRSFFELIRRKGLPSYARRFCCSELKEGYLSRYVALGIRADESKSRTELYTAPEICRIYTKKKHTSQLLPLVFWSLDDLTTYIQGESIQCHPLYYDDKGVFCPHRRLGCLGCPLPWSRSLEDFESYPKLVRAWTRNLRIYRDSHPHVKACKKFANEFDHFANNLFYHDYEHFRQTTYGLFPMDWHEYLQDRFHVIL